MTKERLKPETFRLELDKLRRGWFSAVYFCREEKVLEQRLYKKLALMQVFQKRDATLCGIDEAIAILKTCSGYYRNLEKAHKIFDRYLGVERKMAELAVNARGDKVSRFACAKDKIELEFELDALWENTGNDLVIKALHDGDKIKPWETVMTINGIPQHFAHLESVYLGALARRTMVASNVARVVEAAQGKKIYFFADRFDDYKNQTGDGYAAVIGGVFGLATDTMAQWWGNVKASGTMPHALIACFDGDTVEATIAFAETYPDVPCISLVDFNNDCVTTSLAVAKALKERGLKLWGVRLDTSENMIDQSIIRNGQLGREKPTGVNPTLVKNVRGALDTNGYQDVKIIVSGGFTDVKITEFEKHNVPVDGYGCGSSLLKNGGDFTADIVMIDHKLCAKVGRSYNPNDRLELA